MPKRTAVIDYEICNPARCAPDDGICPAVAVCSRGILVQEEPGDPPFVFPPDLCQGCSDCSRKCPLNAIRLR
jgi:translation initiation factor RLI1